MGKKKLVVEGLEHVFKLAMEKVPKELFGTFEEVPVENGRRLRVVNGDHHLNVDVQFYATLTNATSPNIDTSEMSEAALGWPTITVTCLPYGIPSSYPLQRTNDFASELAGDIERQVKLASRMLEMRVEGAR